MAQARYYKSPEDREGTALNPDDDTRREAPAPAIRIMQAVRYALARGLYRPRHLRARAGHPEREDRARLASRRALQLTTEMIFFSLVSRGRNRSSSRSPARRGSSRAGGTGWGWGGTQVGLDAWLRDRAGWRPKTRFRLTHA